MKKSPKKVMFAQQIITGRRRRLAPKLVKTTVTSVAVCQQVQVGFCQCVSKTIELQLQSTANMRSMIIDIDIDRYNSHRNLGGSELPNPRNSGFKLDLTPDALSTNMLMEIPVIDLNILVTGLHNPLAEAVIQECKKVTFLQSQNDHDNKTIKQTLLGC
jgi:hypothetical protein